MKGIILAGGNGTRLNPLTSATSKQLLPIYDKPLIFYPLVTLMELQIKDIAIIVKSSEQKRFFSLLGNGQKFGIKITYLIQDNANGLAEAFVIAEHFIGTSNVTLILGDNIFYGDSLKHSLSKKFISGATIACCKVNDPERYGVARVKDGVVLEIIEKPTEYISDFAVTGIYVYDNSVINKSKQLTPSARGELEITDLNNLYINASPINHETAIKFLGVFLDENLTWKYHINMIENKVTKSIGVLYRARLHLNKLC